MKKPSKQKAEKFAGIMPQFFSEADGPRLLGHRQLWILAKQAKWIEPITKGNRMTIYAASDLYRLADRIKKEGKPAPAN